VIFLGAQSAVGVGDDFAHGSPLGPTMRPSTVLITLLGEPLPSRRKELAISAVRPYCTNKLIKIPAWRATTSSALRTLCSAGTPFAKKPTVASYQKPATSRSKVSPW